MNVTSLLRYSAAGIVVALCAACSGGGSGSTIAPSTSGVGPEYRDGIAWINGRPITAARPNPSGFLNAASVLAPAAKPKSKYFDYIINDYGSYATIFNYPTSNKQIGTVNDVGGQGCTNVLYGYGKKIVWIVAGPEQISEYQVPNKLLKTLAVNSIDFASSCAMDSQGDLAVGILAGPDAGDIAVFKKGAGKPTYFPSTSPGEFFDGYDPKGNLFFDGHATSSGDVRLVELPKGGKQGITITTSDVLGFPGSVQWDGKYMTVLDQYTNIIHQYTISGTKATLKGTVTLQGASDCAQSWIAAGVVYCGDASNNDGEVYRYPKGGNALATLTGNFDEPLGTTAAEK
jgi:hypothetical protein